MSEKLATNVALTDEAYSNASSSPKSDQPLTGISDVTPQKAPWWSYIWDYDPERTKEEYRFVQKLDCYLLTILCLGYFIRILDSSNIANAYVSGMKTDLKMNGDEVNYVATATTVGLVVGIIPSQIIMTKVRPSIWMPSCEIAWGIATMGLAAVQTSGQVIGVRFVVGLAESIFYPAAVTVLGSWYTPRELAKRTSIFHVSSAIAGMFSGYLQAALYTNLHGHGGLSGWRWLFIMDGVITLPIAAAGYFILPDTPETTRAFYLDDEDRKLAMTRMARVQRAPRGDLNLTTFKTILSKWHVYVFALLYVAYLNALPSSSLNTMALWLQSLKYSVAEVNTLPTIQNAIQIPFELGLGVMSDLTHNRWLPMLITVFFGFLSSLLLAVWEIPIGAKWFAYLVMKIMIPFGPLTMTWLNEILGANAEQRALVIGVVNAVGYAFNAWVPIFTYPATQAPNFRRGFIFSTVIYGGVMSTGTLLAASLAKRDQKKKIPEGRLFGTPVELEPRV